MNDLIKWVKGMLFHSTVGELSSKKFWVYLHTKGQLYHLVKLDNCINLSTNYKEIFIIVIALGFFNKPLSSNMIYKGTWISCILVMVHLHRQFNCHLLWDHFYICVWDIFQGDFTKNWRGTLNMGGTMWAGTSE